MQEENYAKRSKKSAIEKTNFLSKIYNKKKFKFILINKGVLNKG